MVIVNVMIAMIIQNTHFKADTTGEVRVAAPSTPSPLTSSF